jgi:hypothetical protein
VRLLGSHGTAVIRRHVQTLLKKAKWSKLAFLQRVRRRRRRNLRGCTRFNQPRQGDPDEDCPRQHQDRLSPPETDRGIKKLRNLLFTQIGGQPVDFLAALLR